jgi:multiple sugar transport system permease protein
MSLRDPPRGPFAALFFCFQRYFVQDANAGAVKE